jgi:hypothetical protein
VHGLAAGTDAGAGWVYMVAAGAVGGAVAWRLGPLRMPVS